MIIINIKENESIDKALKRFKKKFDKTDQVIKAAYKQKLQEQFMK